MLHANKLKFEVLLNYCVKIIRIWLRMIDVDQSDATQPQCTRDFVRQIIQIGLFSAHLKSVCQPVLFTLCSRFQQNDATNSNLYLCGLCSAHTVDSQIDETSSSVSILIGIILNYLLKIYSPR